MSSAWNFYPRSPCGERPQPIPQTSLVVIDFYPRSPCGERLSSPNTSIIILDISIHALLAESDFTTRQVTPRTSYFYPRSPCGERREQAIAAEQTARISIHALLAESDWPSSKTGRHFPYFYPRSPCGERRWSVDVPGWILGISIHALLAESDPNERTHDQLAPISIHALLAESDPPIREIIQWEGIFLSTLSLRRATSGRFRFSWLDSISIHALLAESDRAASITPTASRNFYPRSPCGERLCQEQRA